MGKTLEKLVIAGGGFVCGALVANKIREMKDERDAKEFTEVIECLLKKQAEDCDENCDCGCGCGEDSDCDCGENCDCGCSDSYFNISLEEVGDKVKSKEAQDKK